MKTLKNSNENDENLNENVFIWLRALKVFQIKHFFLLSYSLLCEKLFIS